MAELAQVAVRAQNLRRPSKDSPLLYRGISHRPVAQEGTEKDHHRHDSPLCGTCSLTST